MINSHACRITAEGNVQAFSMPGMRYSTGYFSKTILPAAVKPSMFRQGRYTPEEAIFPMPSRPSHTAVCVPSGSVRETSSRTLRPVMS